MTEPVTQALVTQAMEAVGPTVTEFASGVVGEPGKQVGGIIADKLGYLRWKSAVKMLARAEKFAAKQGVPVGRIPLKNFVPLLEGASLEEESDDAMIDRWAQLLVSNMDPVGIPPGWADILRQLGPLEARALDWVYGASVLLPVQLWSGHGGKIGALCQHLGVDNAQAGIICDTLGRLGLAATPGVNDRRPEFSVAVTLTRLGYHFVNACRSPDLAVVPPVEVTSELDEALTAHSHEVLTAGGIYWDKGWDRRVALRAFGFVR